MADPKFFRLGREMQTISDSATWKEYRKHFPRAKVGFVHHGEDRILLTLVHPRGMFRGIVKYADTAKELIEIAHLALIEERGIEVH